jgi:geranylgeranyl diphosphate synthase, type II
MQTEPIVPALLSEYGALTRQTINKYLPSRAPYRYLYDLLPEYPYRGGKMMRPSLCIAMARIFGATRDQAVRTAASIEILHNAMLIHDDIEDESTERRGKPTLHLRHGIPLAINAGDSLAFIGLQPLLENRTTIGPRMAARILEEAILMARETAEGQAMELGWRRDNRMALDASDYLTMTLKKTCWLAVIYPARAGALIGAGEGVELEPFVRFGFFLGAAFQIQDDLLNFVADERYGKELYGDLLEGKRTLMLIRLLDVAEPLVQHRLGQILALPRNQRTESQLSWIRQTMDQYQCVEYAREMAHGLAGAAEHELSLLLAGMPASRDKQFVEGLVTWIFERT